ncbi:hypothetical protein [Persicobacter diffluens]|uniref:Uncharacterized protein n=1 Tax=Persicobacter diffluens TaxID=981 RepID=A0AAN4W5K4_9BACT|nr:hypothetical protein PEDI_55950 [Persicobacter diffluens]
MDNQDEQFFYIDGKPCIKNGKKIIFGRECNYCGNLFFPSRANNYYCSNSCKVQKCYERHPERYADRFNKTAFSFPNLNQNNDIQDLLQQLNGMSESMDKIINSNEYKSGGIPENRLIEIRNQHKEELIQMNSKLSHVIQDLEANKKETLKFQWTRVAENFVGTAAFSGVKSFATPDKKKPMTRADGDRILELLEANHQSETLMKNYMKGMYAQLQKLSRILRGYDDSLDAML